jgi:hypothetical protein
MDEKPGMFEKAGDGFVVGLGWLMLCGVAMCFGFIAVLTLLALLKAVIGA